MAFSNWSRIDCLDPHPGLGIAGRAHPDIVALLGVLSQGPFAGEGSSLEDEFGGAFSPAHLEDDAPAADRVGRAVHGVDRGHAPGQGVEDVDVPRVDDVLAVDLGGDEVAHLVHVALEGDVGVGVDDPRHDPAAVEVDDFGAGRRGEALPDLSDLRPLDQDVAARRSSRRSR